MLSTSIDYIQTELNCWNSFFWPIVFREIKSEGLTEGTQKTRESFVRNENEGTELDCNKHTTEVTVRNNGGQRKKKKKKKKKKDRTATKCHLKREWDDINYSVR